MVLLRSLVRLGWLLPLLAGCAGSEFTADGEATTTNEHGADPGSDPDSPSGQPGPGAAAGSTGSDSKPPAEPGGSTGGARNGDGGAGSEPTSDAGAISCDPSQCSDVDCSTGSEPVVPEGECCPRCEAVQCGVGVACALADCVGDVEEVSPGCCECAPVQCEPPALACAGLDCPVKVELGDGCCECQAPRCGPEEFERLEEYKHQLLSTEDNECERHSDCTVIELGTRCGGDCGTVVASEYEQAFTSQIQEFAKELCTFCRAEDAIACPAVEIVPACVNGRCEYGNYFK